MDNPMAYTAPLTLTMEDFRNTCRLCFLHDQQFENSLSVDHLVSKVEHCLGITISPEDFPATLVCTRCVTLLDHFYQFKQLCLGYEQTFRDIVRRHKEIVPVYPPMVVIKPEPPELTHQINLEPIEIKQEPATLLDGYDEAIPSTSTYIPPMSRADRSESFKPLKVNMIYRNNRFVCNRVQPTGTMQWDCTWNDCGMSYSSSHDGTLSLRLSKDHNHPRNVPTVGMIYNLQSGQMDPYAIDVTMQDKIKLIWSDHDWNLKKTTGNDQKAVCSVANCRKYVQIAGNFQQLEEFNDHNHEKSFIFIRTDEKFTEYDLNPWNLFLQTNPCQLPLSSSQETPLRLKLFHNQQQYRLSDCTWDGTSRWRCDTTSCNILLTLTDDGRSVDVPTHDHELHVDRQGIFNGRYFFAMLTYTGVKKIFFDGHCYNSTTTKDAATYPWTCALSKGYNIVCHARLHVGPDYESLKLMGQHSHGGYGAIVKPWVKVPIYLPADNPPTFPASITLDDLLQIVPKREEQSVPISDPTSLPSSSSASPAPPVWKPSKRVRNLNDDPTSSELPSGPLRMVYDGHRYTMVEFFPDGTCFWRCWGYTCRKVVHMSPDGRIYCRGKDEGVKHSHGSSVTMVREVQVDGGSRELFAVFDDMHSCTMMVFRNALWGVAPGDGCFIATCREIAVTEEGRRTCGAKVRIKIGYSSFEFVGARCVGHGTELQYVIRRSAEVLEGDKNVWDEYRKRYPFYLTDGSVLNESRYFHMYVGGFRYTNATLLWNGGSFLRCAQQKCPARGRIMTSGMFVAPTHPHDVMEHIQGSIWSEKRQRQDRFIVHITSKKTMATLYYNTYSYALRDERRNVWSCYPDSCNAFVRIEGDFERVAEEVEHTHDGTMSVIRDDDTPESELVLLPEKGNRKRPRNATASTAEVPKIYSDFDASSVSPKLAAICQILVKKNFKPPEPGNLRSNLLLHHYAGHTYGKQTVQPDGNIRRECIKFRCQARITLKDQTVLSATEHAHTKSFETIQTIQDVATGAPLPYILVNGTQKKSVTYFVCNGFRYSCMTKGSLQDLPHSEWMCSKCSVRITLTNNFSSIEHSSDHGHDPTDLIIPSSTDEPETPEPVNALEEVIWGDHRYTAAVHMRRLNRIKWQCHRRKDCRGAILQDPSDPYGTLEVATPHDHEGVVQYIGEARFDPALKVKDRYAIIKAGERPKCRTLVFQSQKYLENNGNLWSCVRKMCGGKVQASEDYELLLLVEGHCHQPMNTAIRLHNEGGQGAASGSSGVGQN